MNNYDELELAVLRRQPVSADQIENAAALQVLSEEAPAMRQRIALVLANLSYRLDPSLDVATTRVSNN